MKTRQHGQAVVFFLNEEKCIRKTPQQSAANIFINDRKLLRMVHHASDGGGNSLTKAITETGKFMPIPVLSLNQFHP